MEPETYLMATMGQNAYPQQTFAGQTGNHQAYAQVVPNPPLLERVQSLVSEINMVLADTQSVQEQTLGRLFGPSPVGVGTGVAQDKPNSTEDQIINALNGALSRARGSMDCAQRLNNRL